MQEPNLKPLEQAKNIGVAGNVFQTAEKLLLSREASNVGIPRTVEGREFPMRVAWFSPGGKKSDTPKGCIKLTKESDGRIYMTARGYEQVFGQDGWKFWNSHGPQTFVDRLDDRTQNGTPLTDEAITPVFDRLINATIDKERSWRESAVISVDNMTKVKGFKSNWRTHELYRQLQLYRVDEKTIQGLKHTSVWNVPRQIFDSFVGNSSPRFFLKQLAEVRPDLRERGLGKLIEPNVVTKLVNRFAAAYFKRT